MELRNLLKKKETEEKFKNNTDRDTSILLSYNSGMEVKLSFDDLVEYKMKNGETKVLQKIYITYTKPDNTFEGMKVYTDPMYVTNDSGIQKINTKEYYRRLIQEKKEIVKGLFEYDSLKKLKSDYIGHIGIDKTGNYVRNFDNDYGFYRDYLESYIEKEKQKA